MTDLYYMACVKKLLARATVLYPQFATHNALTVASVIEDAGGVEGYEFQRLHGMGEELYDGAARRDAGRRLPDLRAGRRASRPARLSGAAACWKTAPTRLSSPSRPTGVPIARNPCAGRTIRSASADHAARNDNAVAARPLSAGAAQLRRRRIRRPRRASRRCLAEDRARRAGARRWRRRCSKAKSCAGTGSAQCVSPIDGAVIGAVGDAAPAISRAAMAEAEAGFSALVAARRSRRAPPMLERAAELLEAEAAPLLALLADRRRQDARRRVSEMREAIDYCRYYAAQARRRARAACRCRDRPAKTTRCAIAAAAFSSASARGIFRWRFFSARSRRRSSPAIRVVAKPAEQTPLIAAHAIALLHASRHAGNGAASRSRRRQDRRSARRRSARRRRRIHRLDRSRPRRSTARSPPRTDRSCR